jgi:hypothetical protein
MNNSYRIILGLKVFSIGALCLSLIFLSGFKSHSNEKTSNNDGYISIFDGKTLKGWQGDSTYWKVENGCITGEVTPSTILKRNTFLIWRAGTTKNFELKVDYRITKGGNSGINYRSSEVPGISYALRGYQEDIDGANQYTGQNYEERGRCIVAFRGQKTTLPVVNKPISSLAVNNIWTAAQLTASLGNKDSLTRYIHDGWNECHIIAKENHLWHYVNGVLMSEVIDNDTSNRSLNGLLGVQVHVGPPMKVEYKNFMIKQIAE